MFALAQGLFWAGVAATFVMGLGTAITVAAIATMAVGFRSAAKHLASTRSGYGMLAMAKLAVARKSLARDAAEAMAALVAAMGPLPSVSDLSARDALAAIAHDKKVVAGTLHGYLDGDVLAVDHTGAVPVAVVVRLRSAEVYLVEVDRMDPIALAHACWEIGNMHAPLFRGDSDEYTVRMYTPVQPVLGRMLRGVEGVRLSTVTRELDSDRRFASSAADAVVSMAPDFTIVKKARG